MSSHPSPPLRILIADDHAILRAGLRALLNPYPHYQVVGEAETARQTLEQVQKLQPDILLLDLNLPDVHGLEILGQIRHLSPKTRILVLTMYTDPAYLQQALKAGAVGYIPKHAADTELLTALQAVMRGEVYIHSSMTRGLLENLLPQQPDAESSQDAWEQLSPREQEVLRLVAMGYTSGEIARRLHLSPKTVDTYRSRGMEKLGLRTRAALVRFALRKGLLRLEE